MVLGAEGLEDGTDRPLDRVDTLARRARETRWNECLVLCLRSRGSRATDRLLHRRGVGVLGNVGPGARSHTTLRVLHVVEHILLDAHRELGQIR